MINQMNSPASSDSTEGGEKSTRVTDVEIPPHFLMRADVVLLLLSTLRDSCSGGNVLCLVKLKKTDKPNVWCNCGQFLLQQLVVLNSFCVLSDPLK